MSKFNPIDPVQAETEGWCASTCIGSCEIPDEWCEIQSSDERGIFDSDIEALAFVAGKAAAGSVYHKTALDYIDSHNFTLLNAARQEADDNHNKWVDLSNSM